MTSTRGDPRPWHKFERTEDTSRAVAAALAVGQSVRGARARTNRIRAELKKLGGTSRTEDRGEGVFILTRLT